MSVNKTVVEHSTRARSAIRSMPVRNSSHGLGDAGPVAEVHLERLAGQRPDLGDGDQRCHVLDTRRWSSRRTRSVEQEDRTSRRRRARRARIAVFVRTCDVELHGAWPEPRTCCAPRERVQHSEGSRPSRTSGALSSNILRRATRPCPTGTRASSMLRSCSSAVPHGYSGVPAVRAIGPYQDQARVRRSGCAGCEHRERGLPPVVEPEPRRAGPPRHASQDRRGGPRARVSRSVGADHCVPESPQPRRSTKMITRENPARRRRYRSATGVELPEHLEVARRCPKGRRRDRRSPSPKDAVRDARAPSVGHGVVRLRDVHSADYPIEVPVVGDALSSCSPSSSERRGLTRRRGPSPSRHQDLGPARRAPPCGRRCARRCPRRRRRRARPRRCARRPGPRCRCRAPPRRSLARSDRPGRAVEGREEPVAGRVDLAAAVARELAPDDRRDASDALPPAASPSSAARSSSRRCR